MAITVLANNGSTLTVSEDGTRKFVPRLLSSADYRGLRDFYQDVKRVNDKYIAFPFSQIINGYLVVIFSEGEAHGSSDRQIMARKLIVDLDKDTPWALVTFFENTGSVFDFSLLTDIMVNGESFLFKVWTVTKTAGVVAQVTHSVFTVTGEGDTELNGDYVTWSVPRFFSGNWYRTAYKVTGGTFWNTAVFESADLITWAVKGFIAKDSVTPLRFNEADIYQEAGGDFVAVIREENGAGNPVYTSTSTDLITWTTPVLSTTFFGRQPNCIKSTNGDILVSFGDRDGTSGRTGSGAFVDDNNVTGITTYKSTDDGVTWLQVQIDAISSTDGGQPMALEVSTDVIGIFYYGAIARSNIAFDENEPGVRFCQVQTDLII